MNSQTLVELEELCLSMVERGPCWEAGVSPVKVQAWRSGVLDVADMIKDLLIIHGDTRIPTPRGIIQAPADTAQPRIP
jgi:hypothetical protein